MRFKIGSYPDSPDFMPAPDWRLLPRLGAVGFGVRAVLVYVVLRMLLSSAWAAAGRPVDPYPVGSWGLGLLLVAIICVHELIHAVATPGWGRSDRCVLGFHTRFVMPYVYYTGALSPGRYALVGLSPFFVITCLPVLAGCAGVKIPALIVAASWWNALLSTLDLMFACRVWLHVPRGAIMRGKGGDVYWQDKRPEAPGTT